MLLILQGTEIASRRSHHGRGRSGCLVIAMFFCWVDGCCGRFLVSLYSLIRDGLLACSFALVLLLLLLTHIKCLVLGYVLDKASFAQALIYAMDLSYKLVPQLLKLFLIIAFPLLTLRIDLPLVIRDPWAFISKGVTVFAQDLFHVFEQ